MQSLHNLAEMIADYRGNAPGAGIWLWGNSVVLKLGAYRIKMWKATP